MKVLTFAAALLSVSVVCADDPKGAKPMGPLSFKMAGIDGKEIDLAQYKGKVVLFVNVATNCGYTKQYAGLQALYQKYEKDGLVVIGVPANEFGAQEPGTNAEIAKFCSTEYKVTFPMLAKVVVKGDGITPLYAFLTGKDTDPKFAGVIGWNFEKFLVGRDGQVVGRYKSAVKPEAEELVTAVETALKAK